MNKNDSETSDEHEKPQALILRPEHFKFLRVYTFFSVFSLIILIFILLGLFCLILPTFVDLFEGMNLTLPLPTKVLISMIRCCQPFFEFQPLNVVIFFLAALSLLFAGIKLVKHISNKGTKDFLMVFLLEVTTFMGFLFFFLILLISITVILCIPLYQLHGSPH